MIQPITTQSYPSNHALDLFSSPFLFFPFSSLSLYLYFIHLLCFIIFFLSLYILLFIIPYYIHTQLICYLLTDSTPFISSPMLLGNVYLPPTHVQIPFFDSVPNPCRTCVCRPILYMALPQQRINQKKKKGMLWYGYRQRFLDPPPTKQALEHPKKMRIGGDMVKMIENTILHICISIIS